MAKTKEQNTGRIRKIYQSDRNYKNLKCYFEECTSNSSLHGVRYLGEKNRTLAEKIGWLIMILTSMIICGYFVHQTYKKWETTPILVTVGTTQLPIQYVPFPAVTICPAIKVRKDLVEILNKFDRSYNGTPALDEIKAFKHAQMWCQYIDGSQFRRTFKLQETYSLKDLDFIYENTPSIEENFKTCFWSGLRQNCSKIFTPIFTEEGVCYTFNSLDRLSLFEEGVLKYKHFNKAKNATCYDDYKTSCTETYPYRTTPGAEAGLEVVMRISTDNKNPCMNSGKGHKVMIHQSSELPSTRYNFFYVPLTDSVTVALTPQLITTDSSLKSYKVNQRKCYYDDEKNLTHFRYYTQTNCETECYVYAMQIYKNCSDFYMPHIHEDTRICNASISQWMKTWGHHIKNYLAGVNINIPSSAVDLLNDIRVPPEAKDACTCLPSCKSLKYNTEITQTDYDEYNKQSADRNKTTVKYSLLSIYFKDAEFIPYERKEMFGLMDFVAYCGGLLGLFIGFSFIALLEVVYFICFRPLFNIYLFGKKYWAGYQTGGDPKLSEAESN
ncbi:Amiloride-sensitive sodium channel [Popillia japonica]|uniref:Amiloride-sensitive sodium channel n=1 Tax=Popillia japonica TaxID=7064 RepID=A0AAW1JYF5_POPJA